MVPTGWEQPNLLPVIPQQSVLVMYSSGSWLADRTGKASGLGRDGLIRTLEQSTSGVGSDTVGWGASKSFQIAWNTLGTILGLFPGLLLLNRLGLLYLVERSSTTLTKLEMEALSMSLIWVNLEGSISTFSVVGRICWWVTGGELGVDEVGVEWDRLTPDLEPPVLTSSRTSPSCSRSSSSRTSPGSKHVVRIVLELLANNETFNPPRWVLSGRVPSCRESWHGRWSARPWWSGSLCCASGRNCAKLTLAFCFNCNFVNLSSEIECSWLESCLDNSLSSIVVAWVEMVEN